jgi:hypothetical protein
MLSVLVSYVEDWGIEPWLKPKIIICICCTKLRISTRTFQTCYSFIYGSLIVFFPCMSVCLCVRACVEDIREIAVISIDLFHLNWLNISLIYFRTMVSQLGTLLIVFGFWKYGKEYCSIYYITKSSIDDFPNVHSEHDIIIFNFSSAFCTFVKCKNEQIICFLLFVCLLVIIDRVRSLLLLLNWLYSWLLNKR